MIIGIFKFLVRNVLGWVRIVRYEFFWYEMSRYEVSGYEMSYTRKHGTISIRDPWLGIVNTGT